MMKTFFSRGAYKILALIYGCIWILLLSAPCSSHAQEDLILKEAPNTCEVFSIHALKSRYDDGEDLSMLLHSQVPFLIDEYNIIDADISNERILLLLASDDCTFLRIAHWDDRLNKYSTIDTGPLPSESWLDTYHAEDSVLLTMPFIDKTNADDTLRMGGDIYLTFEYLTDGWCLTNFTDGCTFTAELCKQSYIFDDYYGSDTEYRWTIDSVLFFDDFSVSELYQLIYEYDTMKPDRPSMTDELL